MKCPRVAAHFHSNIEILLVRKGRFHITVGSNSATLTEGGIAAVGSYEIHSFSSEPGTLVAVAIIPISRVPDYVNVHKSETFLTPFKQLECGFCAYENIFRNFAGAKNDLMRQGLSYMLLGMVVDELGMTPIKHRSGDSLMVVRKMLFYMDSHFTEDVTLEKVATELGYNKDYLSKVFNDTIGIGFPNYLNNLRVRYAAQLLSTTDRSAEDIAFGVGFGNTHTFYDSFKSHYSCTPGQFRKNLVGTHVGG